MRRLLVCSLLLAAGCATQPPTFDLAALKANADGDTVTLTGWFDLQERSFALYPTMTKPGARDACVSGVLLSLAGIPGPDASNRPMTISGYVFDTDDEAAQGAPNPCGSSVIIEAVDVGAP